MEEEGEKEETEEQHDAPGPLLQRECIAVIQPDMLVETGIPEQYLAVRFGDEDFVCRTSQRDNRSITEQHLRS